MFKVGLTGGIGSGKSTVAHIFEVLGVPVLNADTVAKHLMEHDGALKQSIIGLFGEKAYEQGRPNRAYIASQVFDQPENLARLNALVHPVTIQYSEQWAQQQAAPYVVKEAAIFFESGSYKDMDKMVGVYSPETLRVQRVLLRDKVTEAEVRNRMARQMNEEEKMSRCDFVIHNDEQQSLLVQVLALHQQLLALAQS